MTATWIADALRSFDLEVVEAPGWRTRGAASFSPRGVVVHHTANPSPGPAPSLRLCIDGRADLPGPLCHVLLGRDGVCHVIAAGRANHAGSGGWRDLTGNTSVFGIEAENDGVGEPWPPAQLDAFHRATAALLAGIGRDASWCCAHREWTPRKLDPAGINMTDFRAAVQRHLGREEDDLKDDERIWLRAIFDQIDPKRRGSLAWRVARIEQAAYVPLEEVKADDWSDAEARPRHVLARLHRKLVGKKP